MNRFRRSLSIFGGDGIRAQILRGGIGSIGLRILSLALEFGVVVALARLLHADGYGVYAYAFAVMRILAIPAQAGLPTLAVREVAAYQAVQDWPRLRGLLVRINQAALGFAVIIASVAGVAAWMLADGTALRTFGWALALLPLISLGNIRGATLRGLRLVVQGQLPENVFRPAIFLCLVMLLSEQEWIEIRSDLAMALHAAAAFVAFSLGAWMLIRHLPRQVGEATPEFETRKWLLSALPLSMVMGLMVVNNQSAVIILGWFAPAEEVGVYSVAVQLALVATVPATIVNVVIAPHISRLYRLADTATMQLVATWSARILLIAAIAVGGTLAIAAEPTLKFAFGEEFIGGKRALQLLCVGQCLSALAGSSMIILNMTGNERSVVLAFIAAVAANLAANFALVPSLGMVGSAMASAFSLTLLNGILALRVRRKLSINPLAA